MTIQDDFLSLCGRLGAEGNVEEAFQTIEQAYSQSHRFYHTLTHISDCLREFREYRKNHGNDIENPDAVELALFFHDVFYDPRAERGKNERDSADGVRKFCEIYGINKTRSDNRFDFGARVHNLVLFTVNHSADRDSDATLVNDCDLAILGQPETIYDAYVENLSRESAPLPDWKFREERAKELEGFSDEDIFHIPFFKDKYESRAKRNISKELSRL